jgi:AraC-like DNA-binding protein
VSSGLRTFDASRPDFSPYGFTCESWIARPMARANRHNEVELNFLATGSLTYLLGGRRFTVEAGRLAAFWAAIPHQVVATGGEHAYHVATIPLAWFLQCRLPGGLVEKVLRGEPVIEADAAGASFDGLLFERWRSDLESPDPDRHRAVLLEMEARLLRLAGRLDGRARPSPVDIGANVPKKVEQMATFIARHYTERLPIDRIATAAGLHPNYAMALFRKAFGTTLLEYVTQLRVSHAQRLLATTEDKILDVALSSGFSSLTRFSAAFGRICGVTPSEYRRTHRG